MSDFLLILFSTVFANNIIIQHLVGADPALAMQRREQVAIDVSLVMVLLLPLVTLSAYLLHSLVILPLQLDHLWLLILVMLILCLAMLLKIVIRHVSKSLSDRINDLLPYAGINTTVLGTVLLFLPSKTGIIHAFAYGLGTAFGFGLVLLLLTAVSERLEGAEAPAPFRGMPLHLISLAIVAMAFQGFAGMF
ncbi:MAG: hypothetical protein GWO08_12500 [Gammaproteobacteria bacterium]|nr:hypothetical protein [Gammaproteobacteria bacterium]NIN61016.1 hypothetical protein [Gammaproteobacteria bacterium]NIO62639.1 hypothetical protein [Gammaproteobacteria bacterium]NIP49444.1 hypothetical protein [Gammaproteobacteria bacterium]NIQ10668.1 hypothetical protein [Gammaproteobacteria bacterium]